MRNLYQEAPILSSITVLDLAIESKRKNWIQTLSMFILLVILVHLMLE